MSFKVKRNASLGLAILVLIAVGTSGAMIALSGGASGENEGILPLPAMTITYETPGQPITVGDQELPAYIEVRRLDFVSTADWTDTVIQAPELALGRYGTGNTVGTYTQVKNGVRTEYDALTGETSTSPAGSGFSAPNVALGYAWGIPRDDPRVSKADVSTTSEVCFKGVCEENVAAIKYSTDGLDLVLLESTRWSIPIQLGDIFRARSVETQVDKD